jgi:hypothetical protein
MCANCGHEARHRLNGTCPTYTVEGGWCRCTNEVAVTTPGRAPALHLGKAVLRKLYDDTKAFRDRAVADAAAKARRRPRLGLAERMALRGM